MKRIGKKHYTVMTEQDFTQIKTLLKMNFSKSKVHVVTARSYGVINLVDETASFAEYEKLRDERLAAYKNGNGKAKEEPKTDPTGEYQARFEQKLLNRLDTIITLLTKMQES